MEQGLRDKLKHIRQALDNGEALEVKPRYSVTVRIKSIEQPYGGYIPIKSFTKLDTTYDEEDLYPEESVHSSITGLAVDYLSRFMRTRDVEDAFKISLRGAKLGGFSKDADKHCKKIKGLDDDSIRHAAYLCGFDAIYRAGPMWYDRDVHEHMCVDDDTCHNIREMVNRTLKFLEEYGPVVKDGFDMRGGYSPTVVTGDGDYLMHDSLWDLKTSKRPPTKDVSLQLVMYWRMGLRSIYPEFKDVRYLGVFNPRLNKIWRIAVEDIPDDVICEIEHDVIGYED